MKRPIDKDNALVMLIALAFGAGLLILSGVQLQIGSEMMYGGADPGKANLQIAWGVMFFAAGFIAILFGVWQSHHLREDETNWEGVE